MIYIKDAENVVTTLDNAPDKLRAEIGSYGMIALRSGGIRSSFVEDLVDNNQTLIPTKKSIVYVSGRENAFRDQDKWNDYIRRTIGGTFSDHTCNIGDFDIGQGVVIKNFHHPAYEDATKIFATNQLLNYNLISYPYKDRAPMVQKIGDLRTRFDDQNYMVDGSGSLAVLIDQYQNRLRNYSGSISEIEVKQRNVFDLQKEEIINGRTTPNTRPIIRKENFPYYFQKNLGNNGLSDFNLILNDHGKTKHILQQIKMDLSFSNKTFNINGDLKQSKIYDFINLMTTSRIVNFSENTDEIFLLPEDQTNSSNLSDRFVNQINTVKFISKMRSFINDNARSYSEIIDYRTHGRNCETFFLCYKIEKYIDNDATRPIQTYYTNDSTFFDTQMKYGRKYIYKTKALIGILGSSYSYTNVVVSSNENDMKDASGALVTTVPSGYGDIIDQKYRAYAEVTVSPSFKILEYGLSTEEVVFVDAPMNPPQVHCFNQPNRDTVEFYLSPMHEDFENDSLPNSVREQYFTGMYEIYRLDREPQAIEEFEDAFLVSIDDRTNMARIFEGYLEENSLDNKNGYFEDYIIPNRKYYYSFKTKTYNGTLSQFSNIFEVELVKQSDGNKVFFSEYKIAEQTNYTYEGKAKRILKVRPNIERLLFSEEESATKWKLDDGSMLQKGQTRKFKIRVTSKHTGKKIDLNLNFFLDDRTNST